MHAAGLRQIMLGLVIVIIVMMKRCTSPDLGPQLRKLLGGALRRPQQAVCTRIGCDVDAHAHASNCQMQHTGLLLSQPRRDCDCSSACAVCSAASCQKKHLALQPISPVMDSVIGNQRSSCIEAKCAPRATNPTAAAVKAYAGDCCKGLACQQ